jgi:hypothetical protein
MKVERSSTPLPRNWSGLPGAGCALLRADVQVTRASRLRMKLLLFRSQGDLAGFWRRALGSQSVGRCCRGAVHYLQYEKRKIDRRGRETQRRMVVDPVYFCVMGLVEGNLGMEVITHESVHAAFAYYRRVRRRVDWPDADALEDENICYPAGRIAKRVVWILRKAGRLA